MFSLSIITQALAFYEWIAYIALGWAGNLKFECNDYVWPQLKPVPSENLCGDSNCQFEILIYIGAVGYILQIYVLY